MNRSADGELVRRAQGGDLAAFDELVTRYRQVVLHTARGLLGDWEQAEDAAQQALLEAFRSLPGLQEPEKFRPWLMTITRRCAVRRRSMREPATLEFSEAVSYPLGASTAAENEIAARVKACLAELSSRSRRIMTLHYLDGYSCQEIGQRLDIPAGTVKRILHESRNSLRAEIGAPKGDREPMGAVNSKTRKHTGPRSVVMWVDGSWPGGIAAGTLSRSILLAINKTPKTIEQIAHDVEAHSRYVMEALNPLVEEGLAARLPGDRYLHQFIALDAEDWIALTQETCRHGSLLADAILPRLPALEDAWSRTTLPDQGFTWTEGIWLTLAIFVFNAGTRQHSPRQPDPPVHASGCRYWFGCREAVGPEHEIWSVGFNANGATGDNLAYGYWWSPGVNRRHYIFPEERTRVFGAVGKGAANVEAIAAQTGLSIERTREILAEVIELGLVTQRCGKLSLTFPIIREPDSEALYPTVDAVAKQLGAMGYEQQASQFTVWRLWMQTYIAGECLRELVKRSVLPAPTDPVPVNFCMVGWYQDPSAPRVLAWET